MRLYAAATPPTGTSGNVVVCQALRRWSGLPWLLRKLHQTTRKVTHDIEEIKFNTGTLYKLIGPIAPHLAEELWERLGGTPSIFDRSRTTYDEAVCVEDVVTIAVQIRGKLRHTLDVPRGTSKEALLDLVYADERLVGMAGPRESLRRVIHVADKILNLVP